MFRMPSTISEEELCLHLLERCGIAVHPGRFFGFVNDGRLVLSLLPQPDTFTEGVRKVLEEIEETIA